MKFHRILLIALMTLCRLNLLAEDRYFKDTNLVKSVLSATLNDSFIKKFVRVRKANHAATAFYNLELYKWKKIDSNYINFFSAQYRDPWEHQKINDSVLLTFNMIMSKEYYRPALDTVLIFTNECKFSQNQSWINIKVMLRRDSSTVRMVCANYEVKYLEGRFAVKLMSRAESIEEWDKGQEYLMRPCL